MLTVTRRSTASTRPFALVNDSRFGLQAGVFTHDLQTAFAAHRELEVGGVVVGDVPSYRADQMPYGGVEGVRRRPRGPALRDGRLHLRARPRPHRPRPLTTGTLARRSRPSDPRSGVTVTTVTGD